MDRGPSPTNLFSRLLSLSAGVLPLFLWPSPDTWTRSGPATEPVSLPEAEVPADSTPISGTLLISSSLSIPKSTHTPQNLCLYIYIIKYYCNNFFFFFTLYKILLKNASGGNNEDFFDSRFFSVKVIPGNIQRPTHLRKPRVLQNPDANSYFSFDIIKKKANHTWDFFFLKLQTLWRKFHPEESFHISTKPRLEIRKYHWNRWEDKNLKLKRSYRYRKLKFLPEKKKLRKWVTKLDLPWLQDEEQSLKIFHCLKAENSLQLNSLLALALRLQQKQRQFSLRVLDLDREKERDINVTASKQRRVWAQRDYSRWICIDLTVLKVESWSEMGHEEWR